MSDQANETAIAARITAIRDRANNATDGPWTAYDAPDHEEFARVWFVANAAFLNEDYDADALQAVFEYGGRQDAEFIAASRDDVPWLLDQLAAKDAEIADLLAAAKVWRDARRGEISGGVYHYACKALDDAISAHLGLLDREPTAPPTEEEMEHGREAVRQSKAYSEALTFKRERDVARAELEQTRDHRSRFGKPGGPVEMTVKYETQYYYGPDEECSWSFWERGALEHALAVAARYIGRDGCTGAVVREYEVFTYHSDVKVLGSFGAVPDAAAGEGGAG